MTERDERRPKRGERGAVCATTGKMGYRLRADAEAALEQTRQKFEGRGTRKTPRRVYQCADCGLFHLTAQKRWYRSKTPAKPADE